MTQSTIEGKDKCCYRIFSIVSEPRTGSNYLVSVLSSFPDVVCHAEVFHPDAIYIKLPKDKIPNKKQRDSKPAIFLDQVLDYTYEYHDKPRLIGFKYFFDHSQDIQSTIIERKIPVILLERRDKLSQYSSAKIANKTGHWTSKQQAENPSMVKTVRFSFFEYILFTLRSRFRFSRIEKIMKHQRTPYIHCFYEDIVKPDGVKDILNFLNLTAEVKDQKGFYKKQNSNNVLKRFSNSGYLKLVDSIFGIIYR